MTPRKRIRVVPKETMLLVCATESEAIFFSQMRKDCRYSNLTIVTAPAKCNLDKFIEFAGRTRNKGKFSVCWAAFGFDDLACDADAVRERLGVAEKKKVNLLYFNPSFDLYFLLHAERPAKYIASVNEIKEKLSSIHSGYELSVEYFLTKGLNLNFEIYPKLAEADKNARSYNDDVEFETGLPATSLPDFFDSLKNVCGKADMSHNQKNRK